MKLWPYLFAIPVVGIALDQLTKWQVLKFFKNTYETPMEVCANPAFNGIKHEVMTGFDLNLLCNWGISWGLWQGQSDVKRWVLTVFAFAVGAFLIYVIRKGTDRLTALALSFILTGAIGNAIDRARFGSVVDFVDVSDIGFGAVRFNYVFNVADSFITVGVAILLYTAFFGPEAKAERAAKKAAKGN